MATPFFATEYTVDHMHLSDSYRSRIEFEYYPVGHVLYLNPKALAALQKNRQFHRLVGPQRQRMSAPMRSAAVFAPD
jgi:carboxypeptidase C (cathepsin A)